MGIKLLSIELELGNRPRGIFPNLSLLSHVEVILLADRRAFFIENEFILQIAGSQGSTELILKKTLAHDPHL